MNGSNPFTREGSLFNHPNYYVKTGFFPAIALVLLSTFVKPTNIWPHVLLVVATAWIFVVYLIRRHNHSLSSKTLTRIESATIVGANALTALALVLALVPKFFG